MSHSNSKIVAISTVKHLSRNYASFQQPSVQEWYSLSISGQTQNIPNGISLTFMEMDTSCKKCRTYKRLTNCFCKCRDVNSEYHRIQVNSAFSKRKNSLTIPQIPYTFSDVDLPVELFQRHFIHTIFPANGFVQPTHIVTADTPFMTEPRKGIHLSHRCKTVTANGVNYISSL